MSCGAVRLRPIGVAAWLLLLLPWLADSLPAAAAPGHGVPSEPAGKVGPRPLSSSTALTAAGERYWLVTMGQPLRVPLEGPGTLTLMVRQNLAPGLAPNSSGEQAELRVEQEGVSPAHVLGKLTIQQPADPTTRYAETDLFLPSTEQIFGLELPAGAAVYRIALERGGSLGVGAGLKFVPSEEQLILSGPDEGMTLEELAGLQTVPLPPPAPEPSTGSWSGFAASLRVSGGAAVSFAGSPGPSPLAGLTVLVPLAPVSLSLGADLLRIEHQGSTRGGARAEEYESRARYLAVPLLLGARLQAASWPLRPYLEAGAGVAWARESLSSLRGLAFHQADLLLLAWKLRGGVALTLGPGAIELGLGLTGHPLLLRGEPLAEAPLGTIGEALLGYRLDLEQPAKSHEN